MTLRKHTNREFRAAIEWLESNGWTINAAGTITCTQLQTKRLHRDPRTNAEPRYHVVLGSRQATIKVSDLVTAKFGLVAAKEQPDAQVVDLRLDLEPETRTRPAGCGPVRPLRRIHGTQRLRRVEMRSVWPRGHTSTSTLGRGAQGAPSARS